VETFKSEQNRGVRTLARVAVELLVVFVGVYAAFALSEQQRQHVGQERRAQLQLALGHEIQDIIGNTGRVAEWIPPMLIRFDSLVAAGARPRLEPMIEPVRVEAHMWEAVIQSGGLDLFDVPTVYRISQFYNQLNAGFEQLVQLRVLSETLLIPHLDESDEEFYTEDGQLRSRYGWYREGLERLGYLAAGITALGDSLVAELTPADSNRRR
jgi:hypothetical protein